MFRSTGVRLTQTLARRPFSVSNLLEDSSICNTLFEQGASRRFNSAAYNPFSLIQNYNQKPGNGVNPRNWLLLGVLNNNLNAARSIHGTAFTSRGFYDVLGVDKNANQSEIKKAYYGLAKQLHPDMNKDDPDAEKKFQEVSKAYEVLKDEEKRSQYDQVGHDAFEQQFTPGGDPGPGFNPFADMFRMNDIFGDLYNSRIGGNDIKIGMEISFMEAVQGCTKTVSFQTEVHCDACDGEGAPPGVKPETCRRCKGSGVELIQTGMVSIRTTAVNVVELVKL
jgi:molecular chaperone DnaJ